MIVVVDVGYERTSAVRTAALTVGVTCGRTPVIMPLLGLFEDEDEALVFPSFVSITVCKAFAKFDGRFDIKGPRSASSSDFSEDCVDFPGDVYC